VQPLSVPPGSSPVTAPRRRTLQADITPEEMDERIAERIEGEARFLDGATFKVGAMQSGRPGR
jgi:hypothetical protein